jgi:sugar/nucleoside kinase (ribokinase family)
VADLDREKVDTANVSRSHLATGTVFVAVKPNGQRAMFAYSGAANDLKSGDLNTTYLNSYDHLHLADLENTDVLEYAAKNFKGTISMNPGALIAEKRAAAKALISKLDILVCAEAEAKKLSGEKSVKASMEKLHKMGAKLVVVTRGAEPPMAFDGHRTVEAPTFKVKPVDTTGAGDSFSAGFISHYLKTWDLKNSLVFGNAVAAIVIQHPGARGGLRDEKQVEALINSKKAWHS